MPHLLTSKGSIVNVSSVSGLGGDWNMSFYNAAKGAVTNLTRSLALELGDKGVRVKRRQPEPDLHGPDPRHEGRWRAYGEVRRPHPDGPRAEPEEVADVIAFLASHDARFVTGVNLPVDGGLSASNGQPRQA